MFAVPDNALCYAPRIDLGRCRVLCLGLAALPLTHGSLCRLRCLVASLRQLQLYFHSDDTGPPGPYGRTRYLHLSEFAQDSAPAQATRHAVRLARLALLRYAAPGRL